ncbi:MAG: hypothetical protein ACFE85_02465 [Candidatus Hodarchaeota archaeon]
MLEELKLSKNFQKSSNLAATKDLLKKLNDSLELNKNKLRYLEQDYLQQKNQMNQIKNEIYGYNQKIQDLNKEKKNIFGKINKITRKMEIVALNEKDKELAPSYSQRLRDLQIEAKETQYKINKINENLKKSRIKLQEIEPQFMSYEKDYQKILETIQNDESKIDNLQDEIIKEIKNSETISIIVSDNTKLKSIRSPNVINKQIKELDNELNRIKLPSIVFNPESSFDLSLIRIKFQELEKQINENSKLKVDFNETDIFSSFEGFRKIEIIIKDLESLLNVFLQEINLSANLEITIDEKSQNFFILLIFIRNNKEQINFEELTTPEKIFFAITFYISIKVLTKSKNILFSNLFLPTAYNKRGSIIRTIKKILPHFNVEKSLSDFYLIFILSNFELKDKLKNLKIVKIDES